MDHKQTVSKGLTSEKSFICIVDLMYKLKNIHGSRRINH